jgi:hypothetical protein
LFEAIAEGGEFVRAAGGEPSVREFSCFAEADDAGYVFGSCAALALVRAAMEHRGETNVFADEEDADTLGGVDLVAGEGEQVDVFQGAFCAEVQRELGRGLDGVGVEQSARSVSDGG